MKETTPTGPGGKGLGRVFLILTLIFLLTAGIPSASIQAPHTAPAEVGEAEVQIIKAQVERVRGLEAPGQVAANYLSRDGLRSKIIEELEKEKPREQLESAEEIMKMLGLIPWDLDLADLLVELYTEQVGGFYDPEDNVLYLVAGEGIRNVMDRLTLAHELVHFLQDTRFELNRAPFSDKEEEVDDDRLFAASCLVEGDAMLTSQLWAQKYLTPGEIVQLERLSRQVPTEVLDRSPKYVRESLLYPYQGGMEFVSRLYSKGGFAAVNRAYEDPPRSSEEVMHPEKYLEGERPVEVSLSPCGDEGWEKVYENVIGEFDIYQLLSLYLPEQEARRAAEGWGGNRYAYYRTSRGEQVLASAFVWDSSADAEEFVNAFGRHLQERFGERRSTNSDRGWQLVEMGGYRYAWRLSGSWVMLVQATSNEALEEARTALEEMEVGSGAVVGAGEEVKESTDNWRLVVVISLIAALFLLGLILSVFMIAVSRRRPPSNEG